MRGDGLLIVECRIGQLSGGVEGNSGSYGGLGALMGALTGACYLYASIIGYATLGPFPFATLAQLCYHYASIIRDPKARLC